MKSSDIHPFVLNVQKLKSEEQRIKVERKMAEDDLVDKLISSGNQHFLSINYTRLNRHFK